VVHGRGVTAVDESTFRRSIIADVRRVVWGDILFALGLILFSLGPVTGMWALMGLGIIMSWAGFGLRRGVR
jgi:hypothetical protein